MDRVLAASKPEDWRPLDPAERMSLELLRTDTPTFDAFVEARLNRSDAWYKLPAGRTDVCNVPLPIRNR